ncbi:MAG: polyprenyl diphosphate synthase [Dehalococcoidia bacterium]|nr:polyprenyl diphosphate synthase [Dehalococcoidia bacterium]
MDGNGRWAMNKNLPRIDGHKAGIAAIFPLIDVIINSNIEHLTLYAFSTENWNRPKSEVDGLMGLLEEAIMKETDSVHEKNIKINYIGNTKRLSPNLQKLINNSLEITQSNTGLTCNIALDYGGREEIIQAIKNIIDDNIKSVDINETLINQYLYTANIPDPDLIIRTAGEQRTSNFLPWQSVYSEYFSTEILWPDFKPNDLLKAVQSYSTRKRKYGKL